MLVRKKRIEALVEELLQASNVTEPPVPVEAIAKQCGVQIHHQPLESDLSGFLYSHDQVSVIGVNTQHPKVRQRFTIAHELGHFLLHKGSELYVDRAFQMKRNTLSSQGTDVHEIEANRFAAELLMPKNLIAQDLEQVEDLDLADEAAISKLARRYHVSAQALLFRLFRLGYFTE